MPKVKMIKSLPELRIEMRKRAVRLKDICEATGLSQKTVRAVLSMQSVPRACDKRVRENIIDVKYELEKRGILISYL